MFACNNSQYSNRQSSALGIISKYSWWKQIASLSITVRKKGPRVPVRFCIEIIIALALRQNCFQVHYNFCRMVHPPPTSYLNSTTRSHHTGVWCGPPVYQLNNDFEPLCESRKTFQVCCERVDGNCIFKALLLHVSPLTF